MERHYFDYAASTPVDKRVEKAMRPYWSKTFGNPGSLHSFGQDASGAVFKAREKIAELINCHYEEIVFTGSATEANNLALCGIVKAARKRGINMPKIIVSDIEHKSVLGSCCPMEYEGVEVVYLPVFKSGVVDLKRLEKELDNRTILVSIMYANNEIGTIEPVEEVSEIVRKYRKNNFYPLIHTDAVQAFNYLDCDVKRLGVDLMTLSSQKIYGPKGIGLLYIKDKLIKENLIFPIIKGGEQENKMRGGTENVPGIIGFAKAAELVYKDREIEVKRLKKLQNYFISQAKNISQEAGLNGDSKNRIPNNINMHFPAEDLLIKLDLEGFATSTGSACSARAYKASHVLKAIKLSKEKAERSIRITMGKPTTKKEIDKLLKALKKVIKK
ncbi:cysteine desulfurase [Candidatus Wolfebacteria bacterium]|nr:cysteine desulfurase [Candidatus Wolfebacteria bacterium]